MRDADRGGRPGQEGISLPVHNLNGGNTVISFKEWSVMDGIRYNHAFKQPYYIDAQTFATVVSLIPWGKVIVYEELLDYFAKRHGSDYCQIAGSLPFSKSVLFKPVDMARVDFITDLTESVADDLIPYWRLIGRKGLLIDFGKYSSKENQQQRLELEGNKIVQPNPNIRRFKMVDYLESQYELNRFIIPE